LFAQAEDLRGLPLSARKARLKELLESQPQSVNDRIRYLDHFVTAGDAVLRSACRIEMEGIVSKRLEAPYSSDRSGTGSSRSVAPATKSSSADGPPTKAHCDRSSWAYIVGRILWPWVALGQDLVARKSPRS